MMRVGFDIDPAHTFDVQGTGPTWNGWLTPLACPTVARQITDYLATYSDFDDDHWAFEWRDDGLYETYEGAFNEVVTSKVNPRPDGLYDMGLGLCWVEMP